MRMRMEMARNEQREADALKWAEATVRDAVVRSERIGTVGSIRSDVGEESM